MKTTIAINQVDFEGRIECSAQQTYNGIVPIPRLHEQAFIKSADCFAVAGGEVRKREFLYKADEVTVTLTCYK